MSETKEARRAARAAKSSSGQGRSYSLAAHGENVVMVETSSGRSWALASDDGALVWQPIAFKGTAERAPRGAAKDDEG